MAVNLKPQQKMSETEVLSRELTSSYQYVDSRLIQLLFPQRFTPLCSQEMIPQRTVFSHNLMILLYILTTCYTLIAIHFHGQSTPYAKTPPLNPHSAQKSLLLLQTALRSTSSTPCHISTPW